MSTATYKSVHHILALSGGKPASYVRALDMLDPILTRHYPRTIVGRSRVAFKDGDTSSKSQRKASELTVNCAELKGAAKSASTSRQVRRASSKFSIIPNAHLDWGIRAASACRFSRQKPCLQSATQCQSAIRRDCRFDVPRSREDCPSSRALQNVKITNTIIGALYG